MAGYMFGGFETSTKTNSSILLYLLKYPETKIKLEDEIEANILVGR